MIDKKRKKELDREKKEETGKILSEGERVSNFVKSNDWGFIKDKLMKKILDYDSVNGIDLEKKSDNDLANELRTRRGVIDVVMGWLREIEGIAEQHDNHTELLQSRTNNGYIKRFN